MKTVKQLEILNGIEDALRHFASNPTDYTVVYNKKREYVILSNTSNYNEAGGNRELIELIDYLRKFSIPFFDYKVIDAIALSHDDILKLLALLRIEGY